MNSSSTVASTVSCKSGNKNDFLVWILACLLRSFLGTPVAFLSSLNESRINKAFQNQLLVPVGQPDSLTSDHLEFDFSDVFGPAPVQPSMEINSQNPRNLVVATESNEMLYDDPAVICNRSHSLVGPSTYVSQSLKLSKLTLRETGDSLELVEGAREEAQKELKKPSIDDVILENPDDHIETHLLRQQSVGLEDFEVLKVVGQGAFAKVYQVRRNGTSDIYAMKVMRKDKIMEQNHAEYMKSERAILGKVDHPFIVQLRYSFQWLSNVVYIDAYLSIYHFMQTKYRLYLVLDFVNGGHLFFQLYRQGLFREDLARIYTADIVSAVSHLHANGIMHRDLKPENILLDADGHVMLTDFGLAKEFDENTRSNSLCGTLEYMAPEIVLGKGHDKAADWWSVGILLYEMLTGKVGLPYWFS
ncbi:serine/threonine-protein kinase AtPK2/AtPK19-like isoform X2 [Gossypium australe]|uniref:Serine/threonine-protein kinase AtPK2/AtPK19-like isoform X2 n=1 Tax=Gossypium australe TaxID=47621 RepID=A0A5B6U8A2_9ROSI|nr:serine/threonine-protein kinase AtPK2/AtPK19-like isoform X2 [Gossypium australe]